MNPRVGRNVQASYSSRARLSIFWASHKANYSSLAAGAAAARPHDQSVAPPCGSGGVRPERDRRACGGTQAAKPQFPAISALSKRQTASLHSKNRRYRREISQFSRVVMRYIANVTHDNANVLHDNANVSRRNANVSHDNANASQYIANVMTYIANATRYIANATRYIGDARRYIGNARRRIAVAVRCKASTTRRISIGRQRERHCQRSQPARKNSYCAARLTCVVSRPLAAASRQVNFTAVTTQRRSLSVSACARPDYSNHRRPYNQQKEVQRHG
jgi:hypothetical protein